MRKQFKLWNCFGIFISSFGFSNLSWKVWCRPPWFMAHESWWRRIDGHMMGSSRNRFMARFSCGSSTLEHTCLLSEQCLSTCSPIRLVQYSNIYVEHVMFELELDKVRLAAGSLVRTKFNFTWFNKSIFTARRSFNFTDLFNILLVTLESRSLDSGRALDAQASVVTKSIAEEVVQCAPNALWQASAQGSGDFIAQSEWTERLAVQMTWANIEWWLVINGSSSFAFL